jgi:hypothetical protein
MIFEFLLFMGIYLLVKNFYPKSNFLLECRNSYYSNKERLGKIETSVERWAKLKTRLNRIKMFFVVCFVVIACVHFLLTYAMTKTIFTIMIFFLFVYLIVITLENKVKHEAEKIQIENDMIVFKVVSNLSEEFKETAIKYLQKEQMESHAKSKHDRETLALETRKVNHEIQKLQAKNQLMRFYHKYASSYSLCEDCKKIVQREKSAAEPISPDMLLGPSPRRVRKRSLSLVNLNNLSSYDFQSTKSDNKAKTADAEPEYRIEVVCKQKCLENFSKLFSKLKAVSDSTS